MIDGIRVSAIECNINQVCMQIGVLDENNCWLHSLVFLDLEIHGRTIRVLVDTGATHNFMTIGLAKEVGLHLTPKQVEVKVVNSRAKVLGLESDVLVQIVDWQGCLDFIVMEMNDFDMILGPNFLKGNKAIVVPFCNGIMLIGDTRTWTFPTH